MKNLLLAVVFLTAGSCLFLTCKTETAVENFLPSERDPEAETEVHTIHLGKKTTSTYLKDIAQVGLYHEAGAVNCLVISKSDSNRMIAGAQNGGVWVSVNRGKTWTPVDDFANSLRVSSMTQNEFRPNEIYYSTGVDIYQNGTLLHDIYRSMDGGLSFSNLVCTDTALGAVKKIVASPADANTVYLMRSFGQNNSAGSLWRTTDNFVTFHKVFQPPFGSLTDFIVLPDGTVEVTEGSRIWKSPNGSLGSFVQSGTGISSNVTAIHLSACKSQPQRQYAIATTISGGHNFVYKSTNGGAAWTFIDTVSVGRPTVISVKPDDPDFVICGSIDIFASTNGGATWQQTVGGYDNRSINYDPNRPGIVFITSDFGISSIEVAPLTATSFTIMKSLDSTLNTQEIHAGDYFATGTRCIVGLQDLGSRLVKTGVEQGIFIGGGDGAYAFGSKQDSNKGYFSSQGGRIRQSTALSNYTWQHVLNQLDADNNGSVDEEAMFIHPFVMNDADDDQLYFPTMKRVWRTTNGGTTWTPISKNYYNWYRRLSITASKKQNPIVYWCDDDSVFVLPNAATAAPMTETGIPSPGLPVKLVIDANNDSCVFFVKDGTPAQILYSGNFFTGPVQWTNITANLPAGVTPLCIAAYPGDKNILLVGALEGGIYITTDGGATWDREAGFPHVQVKDIKIRPSDKKIFIFTYGRGAWTADFYQSLSVNNNIVLPELVSASPNPFHDAINLSVGNKLEDATVILTSLSGAVVFQKRMNIFGNTVIRPAGLTPGIYLLAVYKNKSLVFSRKMVQL